MGVLNMSIGTDHPNAVAVLTVVAAFAMSAGVRLLLGRVDPCLGESGLGSDSWVGRGSGVRVGPTTGLNGLILLPTSPCTDNTRSKHSVSSVPTATRNSTESLPWTKLYRPKPLPPSPRPQRVRPPTRSSRGPCALQPTSYLHGTTTMTRATAGQRASVSPKASGTQP